MAGILGRSFPIRPHLARPLVGAAAGPAIVTVPYLITEQAQRRAHIRRTTPKPHLAPMTFAGPREDPFLLGLFIGQAIPRALTSRALNPRPHLARPITTTVVVGEMPLVLGTFVARQARRRPLTRRTVPRPHTTGPLVGPAVGPAIVTAPYVVTHQAQRRALVGRTVPIPHLAPIDLTPVAPGVLPLVLQTTVQRQAHDRMQRFCRDAITRPHLPPFLAPPEEETFITGIFTFQAVNRALYGRNAPKPHLPPSPVFQPPQPPYAVQTIVSRLARARMSVGRTVPRPHLARPVLVVPPVQPATIVSQALYRPQTRRTVPLPHLARPTLTQPTALRPHLLQTVVSRQAMRRPLTRRTVPKPHLAKPNVGQYVPPAPPANRWLMHRRRSIRGTNRPLRSRRQ